MSSTFHNIVGTSRPLQRLIRRVRNVAPFDVPVLISGESGSGKDLVARAIHAESPRADGPFIAINTGAISPELVASELFGHEKGAFTGATHAKIGVFEAADKGTLFLDEIGTMPAEVQISLLRVLESRTITRVGGTSSIAVDVRVVAATNLDPARAVREKILRSDLYYRLGVYTLKMPPLRNRRDDIPALVNHFLSRIGTRYRKPGVMISDAALLRLKRYSWPGNVRELQNVLTQLVLGTEQLSISEAEVAGAVRSISTMAAPEYAPNTDSDADSPADQRERAPEQSSEDMVDAALGRSELSIPQVEERLIRITLQKVDGNRTRAARVLGISRKSLYNKIQQYDIEV